MNEKEFEKFLMELGIGKNSIVDILYIVNGGYFYIYQRGYDEGYSEGYDEGYSEGYDEGEETSCD